MTEQNAREAMEVWREAKQAWDIARFGDHNTSAAAVIAAKLAEKDADIAALQRLVHPLVDSASKFNGVYLCQDRFAAPFQGKMMLALQAINREMPSLFNPPSPQTRKPRP